MTDGLRTQSGKRLLADKGHHGMGCMAFALKGSVLVDGKAVSGPLPDPCECGLGDAIRAIEADTLDSLTAERDELRAAAREYLAHDGSGIKRTDEWAGDWDAHFYLAALDRLRAALSEGGSK